ncbi:hypothetical protein [Leptolyngbya iicbica]|uniref:Uncharacterized protein n=2 Tax=Cyanophyceae TaxID=3028117 RepID=A0A4Q7E694_9CYAN|nr:hypothetical protein [Leptolyngbya sp. LK]RZM77882.1 hypothetical protein DYY88_15075 [Leptolyngbya sp. LK]
MDKYFFVARGIKNGQEEISEQEYISLKRAKDFLFKAMSIEEHFNSVIENYIELEKDFYGCSLRNVVFCEGLNMSLSDDEQWCRSVEKIYFMNRRVINLLAVGFLYVEHLKHSIHSIYNRENRNYNLVKSLTQSEYDGEDPGYRVMCAFRNHCQHYDIPFQMLNQNFKRVEAKSGVFNKYVFSLKIRVDELRKNKKFKKETLSELNEMGNEIDLLPLIRGYLRSLWKIHEQTRKSLRADLNLCESKVSSRIDNYKGRMGFYSSTKVTRYDALGSVVESEEIFDFFSRRRNELEMKNNNFDFFRKSFISNESPRID